jgi:hypothetical protein
MIVKPWYVKKSFRTSIKPVDRRKNRRKVTPIDLCPIRIFFFLPTSPSAPLPVHRGGSIPPRICDALPTQVSFPGRRTTTASRWRTLRETSGDATPRLLRAIPTRLRCGRRPGDEQEKTHLGLACEEAVHHGLSSR